MSLILYYSADCSDCARLASRTRRLDWLGRIEFSTVDSPIGPVPAGEIVVVTPKTQKIFTGHLRHQDDLSASARLCLGWIDSLYPPDSKVLRAQETGMQWRRLRDLSKSRCWCWP